MCAVIECENDEACGDGETCQPRPLCVVEQCCSGRACARRTVPRVRNALATCAAGETCERGTCETVHVCIASPEAAPPVEEPPA
ncbi:MAG: hypothetical protein KC619_09940, partial [Myxococcales bacterium]|nr:hypothetical protein [Myxococcales bacterium]